ncbi:NAD-binding protein [Modestobacter sp. VKM Ac-2986]|uniref:potassium channel family protein n=1 Tax=Modestobacter sp. VKM Ac-2986 TaxID=3004140 RepID=UPI0022A9FCBE|nr:NAD-binding protein [Modestobacter sp. VKM Ac-2986]MCZ2829107.1 NAD-binding protein [Modestobacter sp. VKM Ac-2986]
MTTRLRALWHDLVPRDERRGRRAALRLSASSTARSAEAIFLVLRRMRTPLIALIVVFAVSTLGLTLIPGQDADGNPARMSFFDAFYVISYTATTIGFGEIPNPFTYGQRLWVTFSIYLSVIGWAYAIGSLLALLRDRAFRAALARQHFTRKVARLREPFVLIAGYGRTGELLGRSIDRLGRRFVVVDLASERIEDLELDSYTADVPGLTGDARDPGNLAVAGLDHPSCAAVVALTDDEEANLAVVMAAALLRPDLPVIARVTSPVIAERMRAFGDPSTVNPLDRFGDHLRLALRAPAAYQLLTWLEAGPGADLPDRGSPPRNGHWVVVGYGRLGRELTRDLRAEGLAVTVIDPGADDPDAAADSDLVVGDGSDPAVLGDVDLEHAVGFLASTDNDTTNLSLVAAARRINPELFVGARQNSAANAPLFTAMELDALLVPAEVIAHEVYAQLSTPLLWRFLRHLPSEDDGWAAEVLGRLVGLCGTRLQTLWKVRLTPQEAPAVQGWLATGGARLGDLLRNPEDRDVALHAVPLLVLRGDEATAAPGEDFVLAPGDELLLAGWSAAERALTTMLEVEAVHEYVLTGRRVPASWIWRKLTPADRG